MLDFQMKMKDKWKRRNLETMMRVKEIPGNLRITTVHDGISPDSVGGVFNENLRSVVDGWGLPKDLGCPDGGVLLALDGV